MIALVLAAAVATSPLQGPSGDCASPSVKTAGPAKGLGLRKLGDLPDALEIRAVMRSVGGCQYQDVIRFHASTPGPTYPPGTLAPVGGGIEPATPAAEVH